MSKRNGDRARFHASTRRRAKQRAKLRDLSRKLAEHKGNPASESRPTHDAAA